MHSQLGVNARRETLQNSVESRARAHRSLSLLSVDIVVAAQIDFGALAINELLIDFRLVVGKLLGYRSEGLLQIRLTARGQVLSPVQCEVEMRAPVVDLLALARGVLVGVQELLVRLVQGLRKSAQLSIAGLGSIVLQARRIGQELAERIPTQMTLLLELLHVLGG